VTPCAAVRGSSLVFAYRACVVQRLPCGRAGTLGRCGGFAPRHLQEIRSMPTLKLSGLLAILIAAAVLALSLAPSPEPDPSWSSLPVIDLSATVSQGSSGA
jgi:hypothetical protein